MSHDITLIFPESEFLLDQAVFPPLGILYLAAALEMNDYKVQCLDMGAGDSVDDIDADTVGISVTTPQRDAAFRIAKHCHDNGKNVLMGGHLIKYVLLLLRSNYFQQFMVLRCFVVEKPKRLQV